MTSGPLTRLKSNLGQIQNQGWERRQKHGQEKEQWIGRAQGKTQLWNHNAVLGTCASVQQTSYQPTNRLTDRRAPPLINVCWGKLKWKQERLVLERKEKRKDTRRKLSSFRTWSKRHNHPTWPVWTIKDSKTQKRWTSLKPPKALIPRLFGFE